MDESYIMKKKILKNVTSFVDVVLQNLKKAYLKTVVYLKQN